MWFLGSSQLYNHPHSPLILLPSQPYPVYQTYVSHLCNTADHVGALPRFPQIPFFHVWAPLAFSVVLLPKAYLRLFFRECPLGSWSLLDFQAQTAGGAWVFTSLLDSPELVTDGEGEQRPSSLASHPDNSEA